MATSFPTRLLTNDALSRVAADVAVPTYDRAGLRRAIVHLGVGGFHRAHLATYVDELCAAGHRDWSIVGAGVLPGDATMNEVLTRQDHLYTLLVRGTDETTIRVIGSIVDFVHAGVDPAPIVERIADPRTQIVSMTVTEGGYPVDDSGEYLATSATAGPSSAFGVIAAGLAGRYANGAGPVTVISCDNIIGNGGVARAATLGEAAPYGTELIEWITEHVSFPNSMVDRITPATTDDDRAWLAGHTGLVDGWPVVTEPFRQWVIEDNFAGDRLPLEQMDVIVTDDVEPYELMKLRLLNAGHSCLAYLAALLGIEMVHEALADDDIHRFLVQFLAVEARPAVPDVGGIDLDDYIDSLVERFSNPNIGDQISRLCLDGTAKFPKFLLPTIRYQLAAGGPVALGAVALAGWCQYLTVGADPDSSIRLSPDPAIERALECARASIDDPVRFLDLDLVFDASLRTGRFADEFVTALTTLRTDGVRSTIGRALS